MDLFIHLFHDFMIKECAISNCEQCKASDQSAMGECTKCATVCVLDKGTCSDNSCKSKI